MKLGCDLSKSSLRPSGGGDGNISTLPEGAIDPVTYPNFTPQIQVGAVTPGQELDFDLVVTDYVGGTIQLGFDPLTTASNRVIIASANRASSPVRVTVPAGVTDLAWRPTGGGFTGTIDITVTVVS